MAQLIFDEKSNLEYAVSNEKDLHRFSINGPRGDGRCHVCGRHISELKPFGGPGDPVVGDFSGALLIKKFRPEGRYDAESEEALARAERETNGRDEVLPWLIANYGEKNAEDFLMLVDMHRSPISSWECRDCAVLNEDEYFEKQRQRNQEQGNEEMYPSEEGAEQTQIN